METAEKQGKGSPNLQARRIVEEQLRENERQIAATEQQLLGLRMAHEALSTALRNIDQLDPMVRSATNDGTSVTPPASTIMAHLLPRNPVWRQVFLLLQEYPDGLHYRDPFEKAVQRGIKIPGDNPLGNLATHLARSEQLERIGKGVYKLK